MRNRARLTHILALFGALLLVTGTALPTPQPALAQSSSAQVDVVFVMDTSGSMNDEFAALCGQIPRLIDELQQRGITVHYQMMGIFPVLQISEPLNCAQSFVSQAIPGAVSSDLEDWGPAVRDLSLGYDWQRNHVRLIIPISDEPPYHGEPCEDPGSDRTAIQEATLAAVRHDVRVAPILGSGYDEFPCTLPLAESLAQATAGRVFLSTTPATDLVDGIVGVIGFVAKDRDGDGIPDDQDPQPDDPCLPDRQRVCLPRQLCGVSNTPHWDDDQDGRSDEEIENGLDDDGDGLVDEDVGGVNCPYPMQVCGLSNSRGFDDDQDGKVDEELEGGLDDDGDGYVDEDVSCPCPPDQKFGFDDTPGIDDDGDRQVDEERDDGLDNDGDGCIDEDVGNKLPRPQIVLPQNDTRSLNCLFDAAGIGEPGSTLKLVAVRLPPILPIPGEFLRGLGTVTVGSDGKWVLRSVPLEWHGDNFLLAWVEKDGLASAFSDVVHMDCHRPQVVAYTPGTGTTPIPADLSGGPHITFQFDVPMDEASINRSSVYLVSEDLDTVHGSVVRQPPSPGQEPVYVFEPDSKLSPGTKYTMNLGNAIHAAAPHQAVYIDPFSWPVLASGVKKAELAQAIRQVADRAKEKLNTDVWSISLMYETADSIEDNLRVARLLTDILSTAARVVEFRKNFRDISKHIANGQFDDYSLVVDLSSAALFFYNSNDLISRGADWVVAHATNQPAYNQRDMDLVAAAVEKMRQQHRPPLWRRVLGQVVEDPFNQTELEIVLRGADRESPIHVPIYGNNLPRRWKRNITGTGNVGAEITIMADKVIARLPDPLPADFPSDAVMDDLKQLSRDLTRSSSWLTAVEYTGFVYAEDGEPKVTRLEENLGQVGQKRAIFPELAEALEKKNEVDIGLVKLEAVNLSLSIAAIYLGGHGAEDLAQIDDLGLIPEAMVAGWQFSGMMPGDPLPRIKELPPSMLAALPVEASKTYQICSEAFDAVFWQALGMRPEPEGRIPFLGAETAYAASDPPVADLELSEIQLEDVVLDEGSSSGRGYGSSLLTNRSSNAWEVQASLQVEPLVPAAGIPSFAGRGESVEPVIVQPGESARLDLSYQALAPAVTGNAHLQARIELTATPAGGGWPRRMGPWTGTFRVGTAAQLEGLAPTRSDLLLSGELSAGEIQTTTLTIPAGTSTALVLSYSPNITVGLTIGEGAANYLSFDGMSGPAQILTDTVRHEYGSGFQRVTLEADEDSELTVAVRGIVSREGHGERYQLAAVRQEQSPAVLGAFPSRLSVANERPEITLELSLAEMGRHNGVSGLRAAVSPLIGADGSTIGPDQVEISLASAQLEPGGRTRLTATLRLTNQQIGRAYDGAVQIAGVAQDGEPVRLDVPVGLFRPKSYAEIAGEFAGQAPGTDGSKAWPLLLLIPLGCGFALLLVLRGTAGAALYPLEPSSGGRRQRIGRSPWPIGRGVDKGLDLSDPLVSRSHAQIVRRGGTYTIQDLGSKTGTFVNHERVTSAVLHDGDEIGIGGTRLVFRHRSRRGSARKD